jgi:uncharacterized protein (TIGR02145 family)
VFLILYMKINLGIYAFVLSCILVLSVTGCKKQADIPIVTTDPVPEVSAMRATFGGEITSIGGSAVVASGVCWSKTKSPKVSDSKTDYGPGYGKFSTSLTFDEVNVTYYLRAYAANAAGTAYGNEVTLRTAQIEVPDVEGNIYHAVTIGTKLWMAENLKTKKFRDGSPIPNVTDPAVWGITMTPAYCDIKNDEANSSIYGRLYNWHAATDSRGLVPAGWHLPSQDEWTDLIYYLGGPSAAGGRLKEAGTVHWMSPNSEATNETGFNALPASDASGWDFRFEMFHYAGNFWSSTSTGDDQAWYLGVRYDTGAAEGTVYTKGHGYSVRCVKN